MIWQSVNLTPEGQAKTFPISQLKDAAEICSKIKATTVEDAFVDAELDLKTDEKKLILDCSDRAWAANVATRVISLREKLA